MRVEHHQVSVCAGHEPSPVGNAIGVGRAARQHLHRLLQCQVAAFAHPVTQKVQAEAGIAKERQVGTRIAKAERSVGVDQ